MTKEEYHIKLGALDKEYEENLDNIKDLQKQIYNLNKICDNINLRRNLVEAEYAEAMTGFNLNEIVLVTPNTKSLYKSLDKEPFKLIIDKMFYESGKNAQLAVAGRKITKSGEPSKTGTTRCTMYLPENGEPYGDIITHIE